MKVGELKVWQLSAQMRQHLAWYLDNNTVIGFVTAINISRGEGHWATKTINDILRYAGLSERQIRIHANKMMKYEHHQIPEKNAETSHQ